MIKPFFLLLGLLFIPSLIYAQLFPYNPREWDVNYVTTEFSDFFRGTSLDRTKWEVKKDYGRGKCIFLDAKGTTYSVNNGLSLTMAYLPGYCYTDGTRKCPDYISAELWSNYTFKYGIYEGSMKFATGKGSWPAFWLWGNSGADDPQYNSGYASEIDIAEYNWHKDPWPSSGYSVNTDHVFHWWWPENIHGTQQMDITGGIKNNSVDWSTSHTFKLIYTPYDIKFYIDGTLNWRKSRFYSSVNSEQIFWENIDANTPYSEYEWYPKHAVYIILSQQVSGNVWDGDISAPQTSIFNWVTYKKFFLAPQINLPSVICSSGTATLDVDPLAANISWQLTPSSLFTTTSGSGKIANIIRAGGAVGTGNIQYTFKMPNGETFTVNKNINVGSLPTPVISGNTTVKCGYELLYKLDADNTNGGETFLWDSNILEITEGETASQCKVMGGDFSGNGTISCTVTACGVTKTSTFNIRLICESQLSLLISPNPSASETIIELVSGEEKIPAEDMEWSLEVYDQSQNLKTKVPKDKTNKHAINTSGWKEGLYIVRANVGEKIISGKLWVKH